MNITTAKEVAGRIWDDPDMEPYKMDTDLANRIARELHAALPARKPRPNLGLATTRELLAELSARFAVQCDEGLDYKTADLYSKSSN